MIKLFEFLDKAQCYQSNHNPSFSFLQAQKKLFSFLNFTQTLSSSSAYLQQSINLHNPRKKALTATVKSPNDTSSPAWKFHDTKIVIIIGILSVHCFCSRIHSLIETTDALQFKVTIISSFDLFLIRRHQGIRKSRHKFVIDRHLKV